MVGITEDEIKLVQNTWQQVVPVSFEVAQNFYNRLFEQHPHYHSLFRGDIKEQGKKLMEMIGTVVLGLSNLSKIERYLAETGRRHVEYGVEPEDYEHIRNTLIWTFKNTFGDKFSTDMEEAWKKIYKIMAAMMISGAQEEDSRLLKVLKKSKFW